MPRLATPVASLVLLFAVFAGCGDEDPDPPASSASGIEHVHGLGVDPADDSLVIATHTGLFRSAPGTRTAERIGDSRQDTMGFTVVGPRRYLGSGHPDLRDELPPLLGLIRSTDGGVTWNPVSLLGEADFHVLRAVGRRVVGVNSVDGSLLVSADGGESWRRETPPEPLLDVVLDPEDPRRMVATGEGGVYLSRDAGGRWQRMSRAPTGLLAWPARDRLIVLDGSGELHASRDAGRSFEPLGTVDGMPAALGAGGADLYVATHDNRILVSSDGGRRWETRVVA